MKTWLLITLLGLAFLSGLWVGAETSRGIASVCSTMRAVVR